MSRWKQGDTAPPMVIDCYDESNVPADLTGAAVCKVVVRRNGALAWERSIPLANRSAGTVTIPLQASDTATVGTYKAKVYAEWSDGSRQHYPPADEYMTFTVTR